MLAVMWKIDLDPETRGKQPKLPTYENYSLRKDLICSQKEGEDSQVIQSFPFFKEFLNQRLKQPSPKGVLFVHCHQLSFHNNEL